jgi:RHS repeat-associated protein
MEIRIRSYPTNTTNVSNISNPLTLNLIVSGMLALSRNPISSKGVTASQLQSWNNGIFPSGFMRGNNNETGTTIPKAYVNYIFLDEQFKYAGGGWSRVGAGGTVKQHWTDGLQNINVPKNGYVFVYVSNESNFDVFFDNLQVVHKPGPLLEETHYYPFGLTMAGISSKAAGKLDNRKKFNHGTELNTDLGLDWYETTFRGYDPQIGRFHQIDALSAYNPSWSTYSFVQNNPIAFIDPLGLDTFNVKNIPNGREFNTSDVLVNDAGTLVGYWNGESWAQMFSELDDVSVVGAKKQSEGGGSNTEEVNTSKDKAIWLMGAGLSLSETSRSTFRLTSGANSGNKFSPRIYHPSPTTGRVFQGGGRAKITTYQVSKVSKIGGSALVGIGVGFDAIGVYKYYKGVNDPDAFIQPVHPAKATLNTGVAAYGFWVNPAVGIIYFGTEAFYPGGVKGAVKDQGKTLAGLNEHCGCDASSFFY